LPSTHTLGARPLRTHRGFDSIAYEKGGAVLRMLRAYLNRRHSHVSNLKGAPAQPLRRLLAGAAPQPDVFLVGLTAYLE
jgi:hypothetical protein